MFQDAQAAIFLGFILAFLIGPVFFVLLETAAIKGFRAALAVDLGVIFADIVFILIAYFSTNQILEKIKDDPALFVFGGMLLATYGAISFIKERKNYNKLRDTSVEIINKHNYFVLFFKGFLLNFINIGVLGFWIGIIVVAGPQMDMNTNRIFIFFAMVLGTYLFIDVLKMLLAKRLKRKLTPKRTYLIKRTISIIMVVFGVFLIIKGVLPETMEKRIQDKIEKIKPESGF
ncbi:LysE family transporter [Aquimarina sp. MMG015]|uniref:LysE family translocator n=1 Tax=Aquimarina TaxID=290174 RepID=UPI00040F9294|nr:MULTISPECIES: LysE family transporter [Aquimarina]AXT57294.1 LysE family translocator [Aquimarina sp. AD1]MBQ4801463.1 LysE family transporter [Aquimarina sp. MMG015]RKN11763.1 LysE family translocator [Aquimarina sp. AD1]